MTAKLNGVLNQEGFDTMKAALAKEIQALTEQQREMAASAETYLHLTAPRGDLLPQGYWIFCTGHE